MPIATLGIWRRRWGLASIAGLSTVAWLVWGLPQLAPISHAPGPDRSSPPVRIFDANVSQSNHHLDGIAGEIRARRPQVVALEELTPWALRALQQSHALDSYHWSLFAPSIGAGGVGIWSSLPASDLSRWDGIDQQVELRGWITATDGRRFRIDVIHVYGPVGAGQPALWRAQLGAVQTELRREPRPLVVVGDFNATVDHVQFEHLLGADLHDAAVWSGQGWRMTWPRNQAWVVPYLRIDHVLLSSALTVRGYRLGTGAGSDHRPIVVDVAWRHPQIATNSPMP